LRRAKKLSAHRGRSKPRTHRRPAEHKATGPNQVWCWDITYLRSPVTGMFYYLYLFLDVWSRKIVGWAVLEEESNEAAAKLFREICAELGLDPEGLVLHSDNGGPMKGATMLATLQKLGVVPSFSRPSVSDDNAFVEALFRTAKYRPSYPSGPFESLDAARAWGPGCSRGRSCDATSMSCRASSRRPPSPSTGCHTTPTTWTTGASTSRCCWSRSPTRSWLHVAVRPRRTATASAPTTSTSRV